MGGTHRTAQNDGAEIVSALFEQSPCGLAYLTPDPADRTAYLVRTANRAAADILDLSLERLQGARLEDIASKRTTNEVLRHSQSLEPGAVAAFDITTEGSPGKALKTYNVKLSRPSDNASDLILAFNEQHPEFNKFEQRLETLKSALNGGKIGYYEWDAKKNRVYQINPATSLHDTTHSSSYVENFEKWRDGVRKYMHPDDLRSMGDIIRKCVESGEDVIEYDARIKSDNEDYLWTNIRQRILERFEDGSIKHTVGLSIDISERKLMEERLAASQERLNNLFQGDLTARCVVSLGKFYMANDKFLKLYGASSFEELNKETPHEFMRTAMNADTMRQFEDAALKDVLKDKKARIVSYRKDGSQFWADVRVRRLNWDDHRVYAISILNVTDEVERERALKDAREKAMAAAKAKADFLAAMSHEIRTPMNAVLGMTQMLMTTDLSQDQKKYVGVVQQSGRHLLQLINDILDLSRLEANKVVLERRQLDIAAEVKAVMNILNGQAAEKGISLDLEVSPGADCTVIGDAGRLRQILFNLVGNAIKFTSDGGVTMRVTRHDADTGRSIFKFAIRDTGIGIKLDALPKLFDDFTQADVSTTRKFGGSGLGLSICRRLAEMMGGSVKAESVHGKGSVFTLSVPFEVAAAAPALSPPVPVQLRRAAATKKKLRILIAEDNPANQLVVKGALAKFEADIDIVGDGGAAVEMARLKTYDIILMDVQMPNMDGDEAAERIRKLPGEAAKTPIIALTANALSGDKTNLMQGAMDDYLSKPIDFSDLIEKVDQWTTQDLDKTSASSKQSS